jgi:hypothetical protein
VALQVHVSLNHEQHMPSPYLSVMIKVNASPAQRSASPLAAVRLTPHVMLFPSESVSLHTMSSEYLPRVRGLSACSGARSDRVRVPGSCAGAQCMLRRSIRSCARA